MARFGVYADLTVQIARIYLDGGFANTFCDSESAADRFAKIIGSQRFHFPALALTLFGSLFHQFLKRPHPIRNTRSHRRGNPQALVPTHEIIVREMQNRFSL